MTLFTQAANELDDSQMPKVVLAFSVEDLAEILFCRENNTIGMSPSFFIFDQIYKISFTHPAQRDLEGVTLLCFHLLPSTDFLEFKEVLLKRVQWFLLQRDFTLQSQPLINLNIQINSEITKVVEYSELLTISQEWPDNVMDGNILQVSSSLEALPKCGIYRAYRIEMDLQTIPMFFVRAIQLLTGALGGFWKPQFIMFRINQTANDPSSWECIWVLKDSVDKHTEYLMILAKLLLVIGSRSTDYRIGTFNFKKNSFISMKILQGFADNYLETVNAMITILIPKRIRDQWKREQDQKKLADAQYKEVMCYANLHDANVLVEIANKRILDSTALCARSALSLEEHCTDMSQKKLIFENISSKYHDANDHLKELLRREELAKKKLSKANQLSDRKEISLKKIDSELEDFKIRENELVSKLQSPQENEPIILENALISEKAKSSNPLLITRRFSSSTGQVRRRKVGAFRIVSFQ